MLDADANGDDGGQIHSHATTDGTCAPQDGYGWDLFDKSCCKDHPDQCNYIGGLAPRCSYTDSWVRQAPFWFCLAVCCLLCFLAALKKACKMCCKKTESLLTNRSGESAAFERLLQSRIDDLEEARRKDRMEEERKEAARKREEVARNDTKQKEAQASRKEEEVAKSAPELQLSASLAQDLSEVLSAAKLSHYEDALRELGCAVPEDLRVLETQT